MEMKKKILLFFAFVVMSASMFADGLTATLQQGDVMTPFYGVDAFKNAYAAAQDGAVITLSAGIFSNYVDTITKPITIHGCFGLSDISVERTILPKITINANKVKLDGIYFSGDVVLGDISDCYIKHSWIEGSLKYLSTSMWHNNTVIDQCVIKNETAIKQGKNYTIKNSTINKFSEYNTSSNIAYITNCVIYQLCYNHSVPKSGENGEAFIPSIPYAIYRNNVIGTDLTNYNLKYSGYLFYYYYVVHFRSPCEFYGNVFVNKGYLWEYDSAGTIQSTRSNMYVFDPGCQNSGNTTMSWTSVISSIVYPSSPRNQGNGEDGTLRGPYGGTGFNLYPSIPRITSKAIDSNTDAEGKLKVKITVKAEQ